jgi:hypothetical protein
VVGAGGRVLLASCMAFSSKFQPIEVVVRMSVKERGERGEGREMRVLKLELKVVI